MLIMRKIWQSLTPGERRRGVLLLGMMCIGMVLETLGVGLVVPAITLLTQQSYVAKLANLPKPFDLLARQSRETLVVGALLFMVVIYLFKTVFLGFLIWRQTRFAFDVQAEMSHRLFKAYLHQPYLFHLQHNSAQLLRNATTEVALFANNVVNQGMVLLTESLVLFGLCALLLVIEPVGALAVVILLGATGWLFHHLTRSNVVRWGELRQKQEGLRFQHLQQGLGGAKDAKLLGREQEFLDQYAISNTDAARVGHLHSTLTQLPRLWIELLAVGGLTVLVLVLTLQGRDLEAVLPAVALFAAAAFRMIPSVNRALAALHAVRYSIPVVNTLHGELKLQVPYSHMKPVSTEFRSELKLESVSFSYPETAAPALANISLSIGCGETVGFIGTSGAGKSTLVDVLLGLLSPSTGRVLVDGVDVHADPRGWQRQIGYVPQSIFLTDDTLRRNVAFGLPDDQISDRAVERSLRAAQLEAFVKTLPQGLETTLGERGVRLSGGQRQRIGIARALYHDPAVLVLDEATSSLDTRTESSVMEAVRALHGQKTILIVTHRYSAIEACDRIIRIEAGRLVPVGNITATTGGAVGSGSEQKP
jgi:ABC-type multidrug transport system fused ATPase/permease subunit